MKHGRNEVFQFMAQQSIDGDSMEQGSDKDRVSTDGSVGSTGDKKKKYKSVFRRAFQKIKANKQTGKSLDGTEQDGDNSKPSLPPAIPKLDLDVELSPPKVATYLLEETGDDLLMQNRRTSNEFYKVRKASMASMGSELSPRSNSDVLDDGDEMVAEAILSARVRGRRVSLGGWLDETPVTTPDSSRRASLAAGTWMADLQLARNQHLMQEALEKEAAKNKKSRKAKSGWKKAVKKVQKSSKKRSKTWEDTHVEKLVDHISEEGSLQSSFNNSGKFPLRSGDTQNPMQMTWNNLTSEPVESGLVPGEARMYGAERPINSDNESLPSLRMGWIETKDSPVSDENTKRQDSETVTPKTKKKRKKSKKDKVKKTNALHRTMSTDDLDDLDPKTLRRESFGSEIGLSKSMSATEIKPKRRLSHVFKRAVSKISKMKKEGKTLSDDNASLGTHSRQGSTRSLQSDIDQDLGQKSPDQDQKLRHHSAVSMGSSDLLGSSDLNALPSDDEGLFGLSLTPVQYYRRSRTPSPRGERPSGLSPGGVSPQGTELDIGRTYSPRPTTMYGDDDDDDDDAAFEDNVPNKRASVNVDDRESIYSEIPIIQVRV